MYLPYFGVMTKNNRKIINNFCPAYLKRYAVFYIKIKVDDFILKVVDKIGKKGYYISIKLDERLN